jgi:hypothetical protein
MRPAGAGTEVGGSREIAVFAAQEVTHNSTVAEIAKSSS